MTWAAAAAIALAIVHAALNIGFSYHRNWARWATLALAAAYTACLAIAAVLDLTEAGPGPWPVLALLCLVPLALIWSMAGAEARKWCRREAAQK
jgi:peptidoglycan/LPS O-acetylase OafA/YrhL